MCMDLSLFALTPAFAIGSHSLMTTPDSELCSLSKPSRTHLKHSKHTRPMPKIITVQRSRCYETTREENTCPMHSWSLLRRRGSRDNTQFETGLNRMELQRGQTGLSPKLSQQCLQSQVCRLRSGVKLLLPMCMSGIRCLHLPSPGLQLRMNSGMGQSLMCLTFESGDALLMCMCKGIRGTVLGHTCRSASSLVTLQATKAGSSGIMLQSIQLSVNVLNAE